MAYAPHSVMRVLIRNPRFIMTSGNGTFSGNGYEFYGRFSSGTVICSGRFVEYIPPFNVPNATLAYEDITDLVGTFTLVPPSYVGEDNVIIAGSKFKVAGELETPISARYAAFGQGSWTLH